MSRSKNLSIHHFIGKILEEMDDMKGNDRDLHQHASTSSVACQAVANTSSKRVQARVLPSTRNKGISITYSCTCPHMYAANPQRCMCASNAGVNVCLPASGVDVGVQCDLIPLVTSTPNQSDESWEEDEVNLPQDQIADNHPPSLCSQFERPTKADAIKEHRTRFSLQ